MDGEPEADGGGGWGARNRARDLKHTYKVHILLLYRYLIFWLLNIQRFFGEF